MSRRGGMRIEQDERGGRGELSKTRGGELSKTREGGISYLKAGPHIHNGLQLDHSPVLQAENQNEKRKKFPVNTICSIYIKGLTIRECENSRQSWLHK